MTHTSRRLIKDRYFMLSVWGLGFMVAPILFVVVFTNLGLLLSSPLGNSNANLQGTGQNVRAVLSFIAKSQILTICAGVLPLIGIGMVAVAWFLMIRRAVSTQRTQESGSAQI